MSLSQFLNVILPSDSTLGMPSAVEIGVDKNVMHVLTPNQIDVFLFILNGIAQERFANSLSSLNEKEYLLCIEKAKRADARLVNNIVQQCLTAYYTHPIVLTKINSGAVPPFPYGNQIESDDWLMLQKVFERGPIYRNVL
ncbi:hypothetical protein CMN24_00070 [Candidatus Saccharibacteria bacterium]|nr:hypothetical protein [Candidatus Saccharibacteria bacterium]MEC8965643.1 hypothetical protein [Pseudomonadota bacterium]HCV01467.1 hypothetical protein [Pseudoalteromonas sp.]|tara:strand:+ start:2556 stop:2975 length:420 start_codon:yes stop_codon:yes gene_type:complete